jgi:hypothetical protein
MAKKKEIIIDISNEGEINIETKGFRGLTCLEESKFLKDLLGFELSKRLNPVIQDEKQLTKKYIQLCG